MATQKERLLLSLKEQGFSDDLIKAFAKVKRESFIPEKFADYVYEDIALPLEEGSTISQPSTIAFILSLLELKQNQKILEIGSGSGYVLALISEIIKLGRIYGIEISKTLAISSKRALMNQSNIEIINRSGVHGLPEAKPFDRILVSAALRDRKVINRLIEQLSDPGIIVFPIGESLIKVKKEDGHITESEQQGFRFVSFIEDE